MTVPGTGQIQFPSILSSDFDVDQVTDPNGAPANVLDLDQGFEVDGRIHLPNWIAGTATVSVYADQRGGGYNQLILTKNYVIPADPTDPSKLHETPWTLKYPDDVPSTSTKLQDPSPPPGSMVYDLTATFTFNGVLSDIAAFVDMGPYMIN